MKNTPDELEGVEIITIGAVASQTKKVSQSTCVDDRMMPAQSRAT